MAWMFIIGFIMVLRDKGWNSRLYHGLALLIVPLPFLANLCGWFVTEHGRQPWTVYNILPTSLSSSSISAVDLGLSLGIFVMFYAALFAVEMFLMFKFSRLGPSALHTGNYHFEKQAQE